MSRTHRGRLSGLVIIALLLPAGYIMLADFLNLRHAREASEETPVALTELSLPQPWGGYGWRALARLAGDASRLDPATAQDVLTEAGRRYPLDAVQWLDLARIHARGGEAEPVDFYLARAGAVQPYERRSLWAAAQVALQTGNAQLAERQLRQWLRLYPGDTGQALFIGRRWIDDPGTLLDRMLPEGRQYLAESMEVARRQTDVPLAEAVWARLAPTPGLDDPLFLNFIELLLQTGDVARAVNLWAERDPEYRPGRLVNGDFARPVGEPLALNWRATRPPPGVRVERDSNEAFAGEASLRLEFNGKENVHLSEPWIPIPVTAGQHYRLSGAWRADALTTRALPYWYLTADQSDLRERRPVPGAGFGWERWQIEFKVPEGVQLVRLQLRRDRTNAFDRNIDGTLWLDDFRLEPITEPQSLQSAASEALGRNTSAQEDGTVSGFGFPVSGENPPATEPATGVGAGPAGDDGATDSGQISVGAGSGRDESVQEEETVSGFRVPVSGENPPTTEPARGVGAGDNGGPDSGQISVGAGSGRDDRGHDSRIAANETETTEPNAPARKPETGNREPVPSVQDAPPTKQTTNNQQPTTPLNFRKPETGNPKPGPEAP